MIVTETQNKQHHKHRDIIIKEKNIYFDDLLQGTSDIWFALINNKFRVYRT